MLGQVPGQIDGLILQQLIAYLNQGCGLVWHQSYLVEGQIVRRNSPTFSYHRSTTPASAPGVCSTFTTDRWQNTCNLPHDGHISQPVYNLFGKVNRCNSAGVAYRH